jgi:hypothetical protein
MTNELPLALLLSALLATALPTAGHAADPAFCRQYARAALDQVRGGLSSPACGGALQGTRWSSEFAVHYEWCLGVSDAAAGDERDARARHLKGCAGR